MFAKASGKGKISEAKIQTPQTTKLYEHAATYMTQVRAFIVQKGLGKARAEFFAQHIRDHGGVSLRDLSDDATHIVVDESLTYEALLRTFKVEELKPVVVFAKWLSACFKEGRLVDFSPYICSRPHCIEVPRGTVVEGSEGPQEKKVKENSENTDLDQKATLESVTGGNSGGSTSPDKTTHSRWKCAESSGGSHPDYNSHITGLLQKMVDAYQSTSDKWRAFGYQKAINALKTCQKEIRTYEEALALPGIGKRLAEKIWEIIDSGELRKLERFENDDEMKAAQLFSAIWGVGPETARVWVQQGLRTLDDVRTKAKLNANQKIGLAHYDEFLERMSHAEAGRIVDFVASTAREINDGLLAEGCGSYRRGKETCGDVDVLITHPDGCSHEGLLAKLLNKLHEKGFLTNDLAVQESHLGHQKYMGVCRLPEEGSKHRRLDILVTHHRHFACALMHFTGSALFNRSMRSLAIAKGMLLTEYSLNANVVRKEDNERLHDGTQLPTPTEESIFKFLDIPYRRPNERDW